MAWAGGAAALGELGLGIAGAVEGSPAQNVNLPKPILGAQGAANQAYGLTGNLGSFDLYSPNIGQYTGITQGLVNNPYAPFYQGSASTAGGMAQGAAGNQFGAGNQLYGMGNQLFQSAFDPQGGLYNYLYNQNQQQANAENAMAGVANTPYGAGLTNQADQLFNLNWQNAQLQRQLQGVQGAGQAFQGASGLQQQAPVEYLYGGGLPYGTFQNIGQGQLGALGGLGQFGAAGQQVAQQPIQDYLSYMTGAQGGNIGIGQLGLNQAQLGFGQNQATGAGIGAGLGGLGGGGTGWGGGNPFNTPLTNPNMTWT